jgi:hypothetical protein
MPFARRESDIPTEWERMSYLVAFVPGAAGGVADGGLVSEGFGVDS